MYGEITVCRSGAGWYIGRMFHNPDGFEEPGTRESGYYLTQLGAIAAVVNGFYLKACNENMYAFNNKEIDTCSNSWYQDPYFWKEFQNVPGIDLSSFIEDQ